MIRYCKRNSVKLSEGSVIYSKSCICNWGGVITIGSNSKIGRSSRGYHSGMPFASCLFCDGEGSKISIGKNCRINGTYIHARDSIIIGDNCVFASGVSIMDSNGHETYSSNRTQGADKPKEVIIGNNVWIGVNAIILKGSIIGDNCIVAANSVAKGVYPANSIISNGIASVVSTIEL